MKPLSLAGRWGVEKGVDRVEQRQEPDEARVRARGEQTDSGMRSTHRGD